MTHPDQAFDDSGRPVPSVGFDFDALDGEPEQADPAVVDASALAGFARKIILVALAGKTPLAVERRLKIITWLVCPSVTGIRNRAQLSRVLGLSRAGTNKAVNRLSAELRGKPLVSARRG